MAQETFYLLDQEPVLFDWTGNYQNLTISHNGRQIQRFSTVAEFRNGVEIALDATNSVKIELLQQKLAVWHEGKNLMGLRDETTAYGSAIANEDYTGAVTTLQWYGGFQLVLGSLITALSTTTEFKGLGIGAVISGCILLGLGFWAKRTFSKIPLWIGFALCALNILFTLMAGKMAGIFVSIFIAGRLYKGAVAEVKIPTTEQYDDVNILDSNL